MESVNDVVKFALHNQIFLDTSDKRLPEIRGAQGDTVAEELAAVRTWALAEHARIDRTYLPDARPGQHAQINEQVRERAGRITGSLLKFLAEDAVEIQRRLEPEVMRNMSDALRIAIWNEVAAISEPVIRAEVGLEAARTGDLATVAAISTLPAYHRARRDWPEFAEVVAKMREVQTHAQYPDLSATLRAVRTLRAGVEQAVTTLLRETGASVDPLAAVAEDDET